MSTFEQLQKANETIKTTDIKGKGYAEVNQRIKAFRMLYPEGFIRTQILNLENGIVTMYAEVGIGETVLGTGTAQEKESSSYINKTSYIENCETSAVGRALGMLGIGIDVSIASYEEVANARLNQDEGKALTDTDIEALKELAGRKGVTADKICKGYKVKNLSELTEKQYINCIKGLESRPDDNA